MSVVTLQSPCIMATYGNPYGNPLATRTVALEAPLVTTSNQPYTNLFPEPLLGGSWVVYKICRVYKYDNYSYSLYGLS